MRITVGIETRLLESADGGRSWTERTRVVPMASEPMIRAPREGVKLPTPPGWTMTDVHIGDDGVGLAAGFEPVPDEDDRDSYARFWITRNGGATWQQVLPDIGFWGRLRVGFSWPPEKVDAVAALSDGLLAFAWEDPWLFEGPHCHLVYSNDAGSHWRYARMPDGACWLIHGPGPLRAYGGSRVAVRSPSGSFRREIMQVDWQPPPGFWGAPHRCVQFISETEGFAILVSWPRDDSRPTLAELPPPLVILVRSQDGGRHWKAMNVWEAPTDPNLNRRHVFTLDVRRTDGDDATP